MNQLVALVAERIASNDQTLLNLEGLLLELGSGFLRYGNWRTLKSVKKARAVLSLKQF
jgi:hypothetical protein